MIEQHPIAETGTIPAFEQIIFGMVTVFGRGNKVFFNFKNPGSKFKFRGKTEGALLTFAKRLETMRISPMRGPADQAESSLTPLDLNVDIPSAIVLAVPSNSNMQFSGSPAGVTQKDDAPDSAYSDLRYMRLRDGQPPVLETAAFDGCQAVVFFAKQPTGNYGHGFNMHIDIVQETPGGRRQLLPLLIDPVVRNPGGGGS